MCCHDVRQATKTNNKTKHNTQTKRLSLLGPAGQQGPQCYNLHTYIYMYLYISLYIYGSDVMVHHHGVLTLQRSCMTLREQILGHTPGGWYPVCKEGCPGRREAGCRLTGLRGLRPCAPRSPLFPPRPNLPGVSPTPLLAGSAFSLHPPVPLWRVSLAFFPPTEISR